MSICDGLVSVIGAALGTRFQCANVLELIASIGVAAGTLVLAARTADMASRASEQLDWSKRQERHLRIPRPFVKDIWVKSPPEAYVSKEGFNRVKLRLATKGISNLGAYAIAIHQVSILDRDGAILAAAHPMKAIPSGTAWEPAASIVEQEDPTWVVAESAWCRNTPAEELRIRASFLLVEFRAGANTGESWVLPLRRVSARNRWLTFSGAQARPTRLSKSNFNPKDPCPREEHEAKMD